MAGLGRKKLRNIREDGEKKCNQIRVTLSVAESVIFDSDERYSMAHYY
jgi:hypothetical protein